MVESLSINFFWKLNFIQFYEFKFLLWIINLLLVMSKIHFLSDPFPDNHNGFDYSPKSFTDVQREHNQELQAANDSAAQNKMMSLIASIFK